MSPGASTTEHARAVRAEVACIVLGLLGSLLCARGGSFLWAALFLAIAMTAYSAVSIFYGHQRSQLKRTAIEAEAARPQIRVV